MIVQVESAPAYEFLMTLAVFSDAPDRHTYDLDPAWFEQARSSTSPDLLRVIDAWGGNDMLWAHLLALAYESPAPRDVPSFLTHLERTDARELRLCLLGYYVRAVRRLTPPEIIEAAAAGDQRAQGEMLRTCYPEHPGWQSALRAVLPLDAEGTKRRVLQILRNWYEQVFRAQEATFLPMLERDAESKRLLLRTSSPERVIETALSGYDYLPEPGIRHLLLIPSYVVRPHIHSLGHGETKIFVYGVADESVVTDPDVPGPGLLRLTKALGDERRLRILKRLTVGDCTLHELAVQFGVKETTLLHHLIILRGAGLIRVREGSGKRYRLERHALAEVGALLQIYLTPPEGSDLEEAD